ncbi:MAG: DUF2207 domain-containing protein [Chloroflexota bacterium]|nr:DUF2207 domain-containing protein [Chloroflexota bacterium]
MIIAQTSGDTDTVTDLLHLAFIVGMAALLVGGIVALLVLWYVRGRDPAIDKVAEYITEPPDDLPPGAAGTLLDEHADHHDVVATLLGLARHGAIQIHEIQPASGRRRAQVDYELEIVDPTATKSRLEQDLLKALFAGAPEAGKRALLRDVKGRFDDQERYIKADLYQELVDRKYFTRSPEDTRAAWRRLSWFGLIGSIVLGVIVWQITDAFALLPTVAAVFVWIGMIRMSKSMPRKTRHGAESAARWRAFRTYLQSIDKHEDLAEARSLFDRYLSYAVAFGLEKKWLTTFAAAGVSSPGWFDSPSRGDGGDVGETIFDTMQTAWIFGHIGGGGNVDLPTVGMPNVDLPNVGMPNLGDADLQGMAEAMGGGLQDMSGGLAGLLDSAGGIFNSIDFDF